MRLLHTAETEWSTLLFTLWARAAIVGLAPALSNATAAPVDLRHPGGMAWAAVSAWMAVMPGMTSTLKSIVLRTRARMRRVES